MRLPGDGMAWDCAGPVDSDDVVHTAHSLTLLVPHWRESRSQEVRRADLAECRTTAGSEWHPAVLVRRQPVLDGLCHIVDRGALTQLFDLSLGMNEPRTVVSCAPPHDKVSPLICIGYMTQGTPAATTYLIP